MSRLTSIKFKRKPRQEREKNPTHAELLALRETLFADLSPIKWPSRRYSQFPWILRNCLFKGILTPELWLTYSLVLLRIGRERVYPIETQDIADCLGIKGTARVASRLKRLQELGFIAIRQHEMRQYICAKDPEEAVRNLRARGFFKNDRLDMLNADLAKLRRAGYRELKRQTPQSPDSEISSCSS